MEIYDDDICVYVIRNILLQLCGLAILIVGVLVRVGGQKYAEEMKEITGDLVFPSITMIVIGSIIFVIAFFGCCGAIRESHCMIVTVNLPAISILICFYVHCTDLSVMHWVHFNLNIKKKWNIKFNTFINLKIL